jgi:hypothetical protein
MQPRFSGCLFIITGFQRKEFGGGFKLAGGRENLLFRSWLDGASVETHLKILAKPWPRTIHTAIKTINTKIEVSN